MKIVIVGAGVVGMHLAKTLSWQEHDVAVIDSNQELIDRASSNLDVLAIYGNGTSLNTLMRAGVNSADLLIAVTSIDEINILSCMLSHRLGAKTKIARVRNQEYSSPDLPVKLSDLGIDQVIHPELEAAKEVEKLIRYRDTVEIVECGGGKMMLAGLKIEESHEKVTGIPLRSLTPQLKNVSVRVVAISRAGKTLLPSGNDIIQKEDVIYIITHEKNLEKIFEFMGKPKKKKSVDVMILGGGMVGRLVAERLESSKNYKVKLIESDADRSRMAAESLDNTIVVRSNQDNDIDLMVMEGVEDMGVFAALTDDDENNIVTSLFAKHLKVKRTITLNSKPEYLPIARVIGLDTAVNELMLTSDAILRHLIGPKILAISTLRGIDAEIVEFLVYEGSDAAGRKISEIKFPKGAIVGAVDQFGDVKVAEGDTKIFAGNKVMVFCFPEVIAKLERLFTG